ncbi:hypothetical protein LJK88_49615 [Paenibacillus sp. P26]|nr:hypothetical protein LJK88_49615 [Paenibacillus sp. P26]
MQFTVTSTVTIPAESGSIAVIIDIVRGTLPTDQLVYSAAFIEPNSATAVTRAFTVTGSEFDIPAPASNELVYTAFIRCPDAVTLTRNGPESFNAIAFSDD